MQWWVQIVPLADVSSSFDRETDIVLVALTSFWNFRGGGGQINFQIHFKRGESENDVGVVIVQVSYQFYISIGLLWIPDDILKHPLGALPLVIVSKCHQVSIVNQ